MLTDHETKEGASRGSKRNDRVHFGGAPGFLLRRCRSWVPGDHVCGPVAFAGRPHERILGEDF